MIIYYNNNDIYNNIVLNMINNSNNKEILLKYIEKKKNKNNSIKKQFFNPPLIGLKSINSHKYINAILQCFCQIDIFVNYFKYTMNFNLNNSNNNNIYLFTSFKYLIENLWPSIDEYLNNEYIHQNNVNKYFSPIDFNDKISKMNTNFNPDNNSSEKEFINFIIITIHNELNKAEINNNINNNNQLIDEKNKSLMQSLFMQNFVKENKSIISDLFYGMKEISIKCKNCNIIKYNYQKYYYVEFPIYEIFKLKKKNNEQRFTLPNSITILNDNDIRNSANVFDNNKIINSLSIYDCFDYLEKINNFNNNNKIFCNYCNKTSSFCYKIFLNTIPAILIIIINSKKGININIKFDFYEDLNLEKYVEFKSTGYTFKLFGIVEKNSVENHYLAYVKSPIDNNWYKYNDDKVLNVNNFQKEILKSNNPCILFYQKK